MFKSTKVTKFVLGLAFIAIFTAACAPPQTITETWSEAEFNADDPEFCQDVGETADFQIGKIVCSGQVEGKAVVAELTLEMVDGGVRFQLLRLTADGQNVPADDFAALNAIIIEEVYAAEEGYAVTSVSITDDELTITSSLQDQ